MNTLLIIALLCLLVSLVGLSWLTGHAFKKRALWGWGLLLFSPFTAIIFGIKYWNESKKPFLIFLVPCVVGMALNLAVFSAWGGWKMLGAAKRVAQGIAQGNVSEEDASRFMMGTLDFIQNAATDKKEKKKAILMRRMMMAMKSEGTEEDERKLDQAFHDLFEEKELTAKKRHDLLEMQKQFRLGPLPIKDAPVKESRSGEKKKHLVANVSRDQSPLSSKSAPARDNRETENPTMQGDLQSSGTSLAHTSLKKETGPKIIRLADAKRYLGHIVVVTDQKGIGHKGVLTEVSGDTYRIEKSTFGGTLELSFHTGDIVSLKVLP